ncbi:hypothetical protein VMF7928_02479 [Vibrio marisflavi CECT 7928]|uniref:DUF218 domain-containing protein n=2 Tax=Vibrio marisflavi TaxID=1216040 RepID=A0ABN8E799_9VIBR|nr:hypothetical protein VMF7928_02479 [Vibrio marisflavi CECT 7928]
MLFDLKNLISPFFMPLPMGLLMFFIGLVLLFLNRNKLAKLLLIASFLWIFMIGYSPISNTLIEPLELKHQPIKNYENIRINYILLLGGDFDGKAHEAVKIYSRSYGSKIIISGYFGERLIAEYRVKTLKNLGVSNEDILIVSNSRNTLEEARNIKMLIGEEWFILVASAYHMPRAMEIFRGEGLNPIPAPTNYLTRRKVFLSAPNGYELIKTERAFHEYLGQHWIKIKTFFLDNKT